MVEPGAHEAVRFRHDRIREVILGGLDRERRRELQLTMARRLAQVPELFAVAAEQYLPVVDAVEDAAERRAVVELLRRAADQAALIGDHALVNALLAAALRLVDPGETATLIEVHTARHAALYSLGRLEEADEEYRTIDGAAPDRIGPRRRDGDAGEQPHPPQPLHRGGRSGRRLAARARHHRPGRRPAPRRSSTASSTTCTGGWTTPTAPTIRLGPTSPSRRCSPRPI